MTYQEFVDSTSASRPPQKIDELLLALWHEARGEWEAAHNIAQSKEGTKDYDRLHAYLHRVEGDEWNAGYWYRRAGAVKPAISLKEEWKELAECFLAR